MIILFVNLEMRNFLSNIFPLKNNVLRDAQKNASMSMSINSHVVPSSRVISSELENELRKSKSRRIETSFCPDFITTFLTEILILIF